MQITKIIAKLFYIASWIVCFVPNEPSVKGHSYDEPTIMEQVVQVVENDEIVENPEEHPCSCFEEKMVTPLKDDLEDYQGNIRSEDGDIDESNYEQFPDDYEDY